MGLQCPKCRSNVLYRYGKEKSGKQRYRCILCGMQFTKDTKFGGTSERPICLQCGKKMHLYKVENHSIRYRCSFYPICKTYQKVTKGES